MKLGEKAAARSRSARAARGVIVLGACLGLAMAGTSLADRGRGSGLGTTAIPLEVSKTFVGKRPNINSGRVRCPVGTRPVAGGFSMEPGPSPVTRIASKRSGRRGWRTSFVAAQQGGPQPGEGPPQTRRGGPGNSLASAIAIAYCDRTRPRTRVASARAHVAPMVPILPTATAVCPQGMEVVSGGFAAPRSWRLANGPRVLPVTSMKTGDREWTVQAVNAGAPKGANMVAYAYCMRDAPELVTVSKDASVSPGPPVIVDARCPDGTFALSGGFDSHFIFPIPNPPSGSTAAVSERVGHRTWRTLAISASGSPASYTGFAYCAPEG